MAQGEQIFLNAGLNKNEAKVMSCFFEQEPLFSREIERKLRMRQPEVCVVLGDFTKRGWLTYEKKKGEGKGRPQQKYTLLKNKSNIIGDLLEKMHEDMLKIGQTITSLEELQKNIG